MLELRPFFHLFLVGAAALLTPLSAEDIALSVDKQTLLDAQQKTVEAAASAQRYQWLSPVNLWASHTQQYVDKTDTRSKITQFGASYSQDIFRSGGIYYTMKYADDKYLYDKLALDQQYTNYQKQIILSALRIKKYQLQCQQSEYLIENKKITLFLKQTQYEVGDIDITLLNDALMEKNSQQTNYVLLQQTLENEKLEFEKYTQLSPNEVAIPTFRLVDEQRYRNDNYNLVLSRQQNSVTYDSYKTTLANYLPSLRFNAQATYSNYDSSAVILNQNGAMYSAGLTLNIPLDYNAFAMSEERYALHLQQKAQTNDMQREELLEYKKTLLSIKRYEDLNTILQENLALYNKLKTITKKAYETGYKSGYDLQILDNSIKSAELEIKINELNIELELATLHFALRDTKEDE